MTTQDYEFSQLTAASSVAAGDYLPFVKTLDTTTSPAGAHGSNQRVTAANLALALAALSGGVTRYQPSGDTTGVTDRTAINAVISAGGQMLLAYTGSGTPFYIDQPLTPATGSSLRGAMSWSASSYDAYSAGGGGAVGGTVIKAVAGFTGTAPINMTNATGTQYYGVTLEYFTVDCSAITNAAVEAMHVEGAWGACFMDGVMLFNSGARLLHFATNGTSNYNPDDWNVSRCKFSGSYDSGGVYADNLPDSWFTDCESSGNQLDNWLLNYSANTHLVDCKGENSAAGAGFHLGGQGGTGRAMTLTGCTTHDNFTDEFLFDTDGSDGATGGIYQLANCTAIKDTGFTSAGSPYAGFRSNGCPNVIIATNCTAFGTYYGASQTGTNGGMNFFASSLSGTNAAVHDDGAGTNRLMHLLPAGANAAVFSSDGTQTSPGAMWFNPTAGHAAGLFMLDQTSGTTFALMPEVANAPAGVPALGGFGGAWVVAGATSGTAASIFQVADSNGDQDLRVQDNGVVETLKNTLDDGSGNASFLGITAHEGGTDTSTGATASTPTFVSGTAKQLSTTQDVMLYIIVVTAISTTLAIGPTSTPANTIFSAKTLVANTMLTFRIPKGWYVKITATVTDFTFLQVTC